MNRPVTGMNQLETNNQLETLWFTRCPVPTASGIALQNGWLEGEFAPDGIAVTCLRNSADRAIRESHFTHSLGNSFRQGGNAPAIYARSEGADTVLIGLHWMPQYQALLTLPGSGIETLADLKGKRLAVPVRVNDRIDFWRAISLQGYTNALRLAGLSLADVQLTEVRIEASYVDRTPPSAAAKAIDTPRLIRQHTPEMFALIRGEVDVMFGYSVWGLELRELLGAREIVNLNAQADPAASINNGQPKTLTVSGALLRERPDLVDRYVLQLVKGARWARQNAAQARHMIAAETGTAEYWLDEGTAPDLADKLEMSLSEPLFEALEVRKNFLLEHGFIRNDFSIRDWVDSGPLQRAIAALG